MSVGQNGRQRGLDADAITLTARLARLDDPLDLVGGPGNDRLTGTRGNDTFDVSQGGRDTVKGLAGDDVFVFGATFDSRDRAIGGDGGDTLSLSGTYSLTIDGRMMSGIEELDFGPGGSYDLRFMRDVEAGAPSLFLLGYNAFQVTIDVSALTIGTIVYSTVGDDVVIGGSGNDYLRPTEGGNDVFDGGAGFDRISLYEFDDGLVFDLGATEPFHLGSGTIVIRNVEDVSGTAGADVLIGDGGSNWILGNGGNDRVYGMGGDDLISAGPGQTHEIATAVTVEGGSGFDTISFDIFETAAVTIHLSTKGFQETGQGRMQFSGIEAASGTTFDDALTGDRNGNVLFGNSGADVLFGGAGADRLYGDAYFGIVYTGYDRDGPRQIIANDGAAFADTLDGGSGDDQVFGGGGADTLIGGAGQDVLAGGDGFDTFVFRAIGDSDVDRPDKIEDFTAGDRIDVSAIDADRAVRGNQAFHFGANPGHAGDIVAVFDSEAGFSAVSFFVDGDATPDMTINVLGNTPLTAADFIL